MTPGTYRGAKYEVPRTPQQHATPGFMLVQYKATKIEFGHAGSRVGCVATTDGHSTPWGQDGGKSWAIVTSVPACHRLLPASLCLFLPVSYCIIKCVV